MLNAVSSRQSGQIIVEKFPESPQSGLIVERFIVKTTVATSNSTSIVAANFGRCDRVGANVSL